MIEIQAPEAPREARRLWRLPPEGWRLRRSPIPARGDCCLAPWASWDGRLPGQGSGPEFTDLGQRVQRACSCSGP
eukprot:3572948-Alexandrium_andersonii.AAC.1